MSNEPKPYIICFGTPQPRCVVFGWSAERPRPDQHAALTGARTILRWDVHGLFGLADVGPAGDTRISAPVAMLETCHVAQVIEVTEAAAAAIAAHPAYSSYD